MSTKHEATDVPRTPGDMTTDASKDELALDFEGNRAALGDTLEVRRLKVESVLTCEASAHQATNKRPLEDREVERSGRRVCNESVGRQLSNKMAHLLDEMHAAVANGEVDAAWARQLLGSAVDRFS